MPTLTKNKVVGDVIKYHDPVYSVDTVTILAGDGSARALKSGQVLGKITDSGKYVAVDPTVNPQDGSESAAGVLMLDTTAPDGEDVQASMVARHAIVSDKGLVWPDGATDEQKAAAIAELAALGIITREGA